MLSYNLVVITTALFKLKLSDSIRFSPCYIYVKLNFRMWMGSLGLYKYFPMRWLRKEYVEKYKKYTQTATIQIDQNHWKSDSYEKKILYLPLQLVWEPGGSWDPPASWGPPCSTFLWPAVLWTGQGTLIHPPTPWAPW